jgi:hypothetical protein
MHKKSAYKALYSSTWKQVPFPDLHASARSPYWAKSARPFPSRSGIRAGVSLSRSRTGQARGTPFGRDFVSGADLGSNMYTLLLWW